MIKTHIQFLVLGFCLLLPFAVRAGCTFTPGSSTVTLPANINVTGAQVGEDLATVTASYSVNCPLSSGMGGQEWVLYPEANTDYGSSPISDVRNTAYPGIGIRWRSQNTLTGNRVTRTTESITNNTGNQLVVAKLVNITIVEEFTLVKTGTIGAGQLPVMTFIISSMWSGGFGTDGSTETITLSASSIQAVTCSLTNNTINVNMGTVSTSAFNGLGSTASSTQFRIPVVCDGNTPLSFMIEGNSSAPQNGLLTLGSGSTANGVGIQILYQDTPLVLSSAQSLGSISSGSFEIPLTARYFQTGSMVTAGTVNATATVTLTYN